MRSILALRKIQSAWNIVGAKHELPGQAYCSRPKIPGRERMEESKEDGAGIHSICQVDSLGMRPIFPALYQRVSAESGVLIRGAEERGN